MELRDAFAATLKNLRNDLGLTQEDFVTVSSRTNVSLLERGKTVPTLDKFQQLCTVLGIHPVTLLALCYCHKDNVSAASLLSLVSDEIARFTPLKPSSAE
ncbi:helix-turn-helix transcriptional regulator [Pseudomonas viridiflava]|uniref:helix-turn-helix domain-containing protein n=1 Tax=Pseudomonas viridiflava TaxID=33069 RepID=UPI002E985E3D|nr:helix-turn-helix transcriptional regulator [Pseudomonas viridiflava]